MKKLVIGSLTGIGGLAVVSFVGIALATREPSGDPPAPASPPPSSAAVPEVAGFQGPAPARDVPLQGLGLPEDVAPPVAPTKVEAPAPPPAGSWEAVAIVVSRRRIPGLDMEKVGPLITDCLARYGESRSGGGERITTVGGAAPVRDETMTTLVLQIEVSAGWMVVVDAPLESRGMTSDAAISCAQGVLRGQAGAARGLRDGKHRLRFPLMMMQ